VQPSSLSLPGAADSPSTLDSSGGPEDIHRVIHVRVRVFGIGNVNFTHPILGRYRLSAMLPRVHNEQGHASLAGEAKVETTCKRGSLTVLLG
jgi:hypothetical protein